MIFVIDKASSIVVIVTGKNNKNDGKVYPKRGKEVHEKPPVDALLVAQQVAGWPHVTHEEPTKHNNARSHLYRHLSYSRIFHLATLDTKNCKAQIFINILDRSL
jgi:hypothetical protein